MLSNLTGTRTLLILVPLIVFTLPGVRAETGAASWQTDALQLTAEVHRSRIRVGEPVFVRVTARNTDERPLKLDAFYWDWEIVVRGPEGWKVEGPLYSLLGYRGYPYGKYGELPGLAPGKSRSSCVVLWLMDKGREYERCPFFPQPGTYDVVLRDNFALMTEEGDRSGHDAELSFSVDVESPGNGWKNVEQTLSATNMVDSTSDREDASRLRELLEQLGESPYTPYVKWLRLRAAADHYKTVEAGGRRGARELERLQELSEDLLKQFGGTGTPVERDALVMRAITHVLRRDLLQIWEYGGREQLRIEAGAEEGFIPVLVSELPKMGLPGKIEALEDVDVDAVIAREDGKAREILAELERRFGGSERDFWRLKTWLD